MSRLNSRLDVVVGKERRFLTYIDVPRIDVTDSASMLLPRAGDILDLSGLPTTRVVGVIWISGHDHEPGRYAHNAVPDAVLVEVIE